MTNVLQQLGYKLLHEIRTFPCTSSQYENNLCDRDRHNVQGTNYEMKPLPSYNFQLQRFISLLKCNRYLIIPTKDILHLYPVGISVYRVSVDLSNINSMTSCEVTGFEKNERIHL